MSEISDNQLHGCFVSPSYCKELLELGFSDQTVYKWKIKNKVVLLFTSVFDIDDYYVAAVRHIDKIDPPAYILPAYTIKDCEKSLPDFLLTGDSLGYELAIDDLYKMGPVTAPRLPDVFALAVIKGIKQGKLSVEKLNQNLANSKM